MRISSISLLVVLSLAVYWFHSRDPDFIQSTMDSILSDSFHVMEARYSPSQIIESNYKGASSKYILSESLTRYSPYLLMEAKYIGENGKSVESIILWDMLDGEMVLNTSNWEKTRGLGDCMKALLNREEFRLVDALAKNGFSLSKNEIIAIMNFNQSQLDRVIKSCKDKNIIVEYDKICHLHLANPKLGNLPKTKVEGHFVTKSCKSKERINKKFHATQIKKIAQAIFDKDFHVRGTLDIYLPIYCITLETPEGNSLTSYWNGVNGKQIFFTSIID